MKSIQKIIVISLFAMLICALPNSAIAQGAIGNLTGAAPHEHKHKFKKKIDSSGNLHKQSPKQEYLDPVRGPDVLAPCAGKRLTFTGSDTFCGTMGSLSVAVTNGVNASPQFVVNANMKSKNNMATNENCLDVSKKIFNQQASYTSTQKDTYNVCRKFCSSPPGDSEENREFCAISKCLKIVKENKEDPRIVEHCNTTLNGWITKTSGQTQEVIHHTVSEHSAYSPDIPDPGYCIDYWGANGSISASKTCCSNINVLRNYYPKEALKINAACK